MGEQYPERKTLGLTIDRGRFIGRDAELAVLERLQAQGCKLITVCGPPGVGKSRLLREHVRAQQSRANDLSGVCVELSEASSAEQISEALLEALVEASGGLSDGADASVESVLAQTGPLYVLLDTVEHLLDPLPSLLQRWQAAAPEAVFYLSSRQPLHLGAEQIVALRPLSPEHAVELFAERAYQGWPHSEDPAQPVAELEALVAALDYLPLAIELAAEQARTLPVPELIERLSAAHPGPDAPLRSRRRDATRRHQSLDNAVQCSWDRLGDAEKSLLIQSTVFRGGFTRKAAQTVVDTPQSHHTQQLDNLVDKSLLRIVSQPGASAARYRHYQCVRRYIARQGDAQDDFALEQRHADYYLAEAETHLVRATGPRAAEYAAWLHQEAQNLSVIFERHISRESSLRAARQLDAYYANACLLDAQQRLLEEALSLAVAADEPLWEARFLRRRGRFRSQRGQFEAAEADYDRALALADAHSDAELVAWTHFEHGELARQRADLERARLELGHALEQARALEIAALQRSALAHLASCDVDCGELGRARERVLRLHAIQQSENLRAEAALHRRLAYVHYYLGELVEQQQLNERAFALAEQLGDRRLRAACAQGLGDSYFADSRFEQAIALYRDALAIHRELGDEHLAGVLLGNLAAALHRREDLDAAEKEYRHSLRIHRSTQAIPYLAVTTSALGVLEHEQSRLNQAQAHYEQAIELFETLKRPADLASVLLYRGWLALEIGATARAKADFERSLRLFEERDDHAHADIGWEAVARASMAVLSAAQPDQQTAFSHIERARHTVRACPDSLEERLVAGLGYLVDKLLSPEPSDAACARRTQWLNDATLRQESLHARLIQRLMRRLEPARPSERAVESPGSPASAPQPTPAQAVLIHRNGARFEVPGFEPADLRRRRSLRLILAELVSRHEAAQPTALSVYDALDVGWPGESVDPESGAARVYWAIRTLRRLGLDAYLVTVDDGYQLSSEREILLK